MKPRIAVMVLCSIVCGVGGSKAGETRIGDDADKSGEKKEVRAFVAGRVLFSDAGESEKTEVAGSYAVHKSESSESVLFAVVGAGFVPADLDPTRELSPNEEKENLAKGSESEVPTEYALYQNYPNPFNPSTTIRFDLPEESIVTIIVYDVLGRSLLSIAGERFAAGRHSQVWNGWTVDGVPLASGVYFYRIEARSMVSQRSMTSLLKMVLMK